MKTRQAELRNARFWVCVNCSPVKLTLRPGQRLEWCVYCKTDEGYHSEGQVWEYWDTEPPEIVRESWTAGRDCDGPISSAREDWCALDQLDEVQPGEPLGPEWEGVRWPAWREKRATRINDTYAEAMGY